QQEYRYRQMLLRKVEQWEKAIFGSLLEDLDVRLLLDLAEQQDAIINYQNLAHKSREQMHQVLPAGTKALTKFDELGEGGTLLILGEPGAGKTFALVEIAAVLKKRAEQDGNLAIPVIFNLSTWQDVTHPLEDWLTEQFKVQYRVQPSLSKSWLKHEQLILLLDGLDEVAATRRIACVNAIAAFHQGHGVMQMVVCCRLWEYKQLQTKLPFDGALLMKPLTHTQIDLYLSSLGDRMAGLHQVWQEDMVLQEIAQNPLMLFVMTIAYGDLSVSELAEQSSDIKTRRSDLCELYISRMYERKLHLAYDKNKIRRWLQCLAQKMVAESQTVFYIERMQPYWLTESQQWLYRLIFGLLFGLILGAAFGLIVEPVIGLVAGLIVEPIFRLSKQSIEPHESFELRQFDWWNFLKNLKEWLGIGLIGGILCGLIMAQIFLIYRLFIEMFLWLIMGPIFGLIMGLIFGLIFGLVEGLKTQMIDIQLPKQGIWTSAQSILPLFFLTLSLVILGMRIIALLIWMCNIWKLPILSLEQFIPLGMVIAVYLNLVNFGGRFCLQHFALRITLYLNKHIPWNYAKFLDYCTQLILL
ncbi:MAG: NACHT domain-containing protein, partial [Pseudanabaena sp.]